MPVQDVDDVVVCDACLLKYFSASNLLPDVGAAWVMRQRAEATLPQHGRTWKWSPFDGLLVVESTC